MIPRPVNRPRPIPFDSPATAGTASLGRQVNWASTSSQASVLIASEPAPRTATDSISTIAARLSPVHTAPSPRESKLARGETSSMGAEGSAKFVGQGSLSVRSSVTGRHYRFQGHGDCQKVDKHDLMLLRRIADLVVS
jgi:hypothetical protein